MKKVILILNILFFVVMSLYSQEEMSFYDNDFPPNLITIYKDKIVISNEDVPGLKSKEYPRELFLTAFSLVAVSFLISSPSCNTGSSSQPQIKLFATQ